ncbi:MAG TPA: hypothetical protein DCS07_07045 [Bdellovibrionales bacterium]|nr:MAG: hypothetical protein A2X97_02615 [Bdellovibrionales bacterium GWA1_52_35]HAR42375.1 hypothetical protein [Bdellovibrionales bacterium]HCM40084.1 hypothetical protein [Bdellovibrionales bacterium]
MYPVLFTAFGQPFTTWPLFALMGIWAFFFIVRAGLRTHGIPDLRINLYVMICTVAFFLGAHLGQVVTVGSSAATEDISFRGLVLYGGVLVSMPVGIFLWWLFGWNRKFNIRALLDLATPGIIWALFFGRLGCTFYGCCYGTPSGAFPGTLLNYEHWDFASQPFPSGLQGVPLHPATLYEALLLLFLGLAAHRVQHRHHWTPGLLGWSLLGGYALGRFFLEWIRLDPRGESLLGLSPSQGVSLLLVPVAVFFVQKHLRAPKCR